MTGLGTKLRRKIHHPFDPLTAQGLEKSGDTLWKTNT